MESRGLTRAPACTDIEKSSKQSECLAVASYGCVVNQIASVQSSARTCLGIISLLGRIKRSPNRSGQLVDGIIVNGNAMPCPRQTRRKLHCCKALAYHRQFAALVLTNVHNCSPK